MKITLDLPEDTLRMLEVVGNGNAEAALFELADRTADGVSRPGCWERAWLEKVFGDAWTAQLEPDPKAHWRQRPRRR
jgi:hypothetical protein